jgi:CubicO group peptidase (beta-lactamase class C family)
MTEISMSALPEPTLANWRQHPYNIRGFVEVGRLVANHAIKAGPVVRPLADGTPLDLAAIRTGQQSAADLIAESNTDGFLVLKDGAIVAETYGPAMNAATPHIIFSVSKSVTGTLAGVLVEGGALDPDAPVTRYVPELSSSAYGDASVRQVLDMTVSLRFIEDYLDPRGDVARYRVAMDWNPPADFPYEGGLHHFLGTLGRDHGPHGERFEYASPNSDLLGWILERAGGAPIADLLTRHLWQPLGAERDGYITVDRHGAARTAGGICVTMRDLARFGDMVRQRGSANGRQVIPEAWIDDIFDHGSEEAWARGQMTGLLQRARYRSQWYVPLDMPGTLIAIGIHGQWIYLDRTAGVTIVKLSSQPLPVDDPLDIRMLAMFRAIADVLR